MYCGREVKVKKTKGRNTSLVTLRLPNEFLDKVQVKADILGVSVEQYIKRVVLREALRERHGKREDGEED